MQSLSKLVAIGLCVAGWSLAADPPGPAGLPKLAGLPSEGKSTWSGTIKTGDQTVDATATIEVKSTPEGWVITHSVSSPSGDSTDIATLDKQTLESIGREVKGSAEMKLNTKGGKVSGSIRFNEQERRIEGNAGGPLFADGIAGRQAIVYLPLAEGYATKYRNFDLQSMKGKTVELRVAGSEKVTVPAGTFDTFRVEIQALDGAPEPMTVWVAKGLRKMVKVKAIVGASTITAELK